MCHQVSADKKVFKVRRVDVWLKRKLRYQTWDRWERIHETKVPLGPWFVGVPRPYGVELTTAEGDYLQFRYDNQAPI
jgi:hypothetical protein